ncbi:MAG: VCBS repeat-containing protein, partial [Planctomycetota bacterium]|nr:VCBS repeat-containing protein [Planctomycetota bacterium]
VAMTRLSERDLLVVEDFNNDGAPDVFAAGGMPGWVLLANADPKGRRYQARFLEAGKAIDGEVVARDAVGGDVDNDGDFDILLASSAGLTVLRNSSGGTLTPDQTVPVSGGLHRLALADLGGDGVLDVVTIDGQGQVEIRTPMMSSKHHAVLVAPEGRKDNRRSIGTVVHAYADRSFQSRMIKSVFGVRFGLGPDGLESLDGLRLRWPQGILQAMPRNTFKSLTSPLVFKQVEGLVASCPFLYVHGENGWEFLTDVIGIAPLDEWQPPGSGPGPLDPEEFVRIPGDKLVVKSGRVQLAITEELKETAYLDRAELYYVDHAADRDLLLDENIVTQGRYDELKIRTIRESQYAPIARAVVRGEDFADKISKLDGVYLHPYIEDLSQWGGWTEPHAMELTTSASASVLLMQGRIAWYDSSVAYALHQNGRTFTPMKMERIHPDGRVELMIEDVGIPTGMDRTIIVPLGDQPLPAGSRLRFTAQYRFLWDRIRTASQPSVDSPVAGSAKLHSAVLYHHGYSEYLGNPGSHEQGYDFDRAAPDDRYPRAVGMVNEYGDVRSLLGEHDDQLVVLVAGDAVKIEFVAPSVQVGMVRTWFLKITGWAKEGSFHNFTGQRVTPLPFKAMSAYPPPAGESTPWAGVSDVLTRRIR